MAFNINNYGPVHTYRQTTHLGPIKGLFTPSDFVTGTATLTDGTFDLFDEHYDGQIGVHTQFAHQRSICYGDSDRVACSERAFTLSVSVRVAMSLVILLSLNS